MFKYSGKSHLIKECVDLANKLVHDNQMFHDKIREAYFDMATCEGDVIDDDIVYHSKDNTRKLIIPRFEPFRVSSYSEELESIIKLPSEELESIIKIPVDPAVEKEKAFNLTVKLYKSKNPFSKAYGYFSPSKPDHIFLNTRKLNRSKGSIVSSLIHEMIHYVDDKNKQESYGHGDNSPVGKENTAPYWIDNLAESIIDNKLPDFNNNENANIIYYVPFYKRFWMYVKNLF
jgi:hypothetical protein